MFDANGRVLKRGGRLAMHDLVQRSNPGPLHMPVPETDNEDEMFADTGKLLEKLQPDLAGSFSISGARLEDCRLFGL